jgi:predicted DNA binding CopG/RHH family protein
MSEKSNKTNPEDEQLRAFETQDLGEDLSRSTSRRVAPRSYPTSIVLDEDLIQRLRETGAKRGLGYQTMLKLIVREHIDEY